MKRVEIIPLDKPVNAEIILPGCLSYTIRGLAMAAMTRGSVMIKNALKSDDTRVMFNALKTLGIKCEEGADFFVIEGDLRDVKEADYVIDINISGRSARTLLALLCVVPGVKVLMCKEGFKKRPMVDLVNGLRMMGAKIDYLENEGFLPVKISSSKLNPGRLKIKGDMSSQLCRRILMISPMVGEVVVEVEGNQASKPFIDMTIAAMKSFGVDVKNNNYKEYVVLGGQNYEKNIYLVEPDAISASYFWSIASITASKIKILGLSPESKQGDVYFADILGMMGCKVKKSVDEKWIEVEGAKQLKSIKIDMNSNPDIVQSLAVTAVFAEGETVITGVGHLKVKETDRLEATRRELVKMWVEVSATADSLRIKGGNVHGVVIETYGDHRMAMAFAVAGARIQGVIINDPDVVSKSFPGFWEKLREIGVGLRLGSGSLRG